VLEVEDGGKVEIQCICKDLNVATVVDDVKGIFKDNKNIDAIVSD
jgi:hypothetical protein